jgi:hypothetical protein
MKINSVGQNNAISNYSDGVTKSSEKAAPVVNVTDKLELSEGAQKFSEMIKAAKEDMDNLSTQDDKKTDDIIARMKNGSYKTSDSDVIASILQGYAE